MKIRSVSSVTHEALKSTWAELRSFKVGYFGAPKSSKTSHIVEYNNLEQSSTLSCRGPKRLSKTGLNSISIVLTKSFI